MSERLKLAFCTGLLFFFPVFLAAQQTEWVAELHRADSFPIRFNLDIHKRNQGDVWTIRNADERIPVTHMRKNGDSMAFEMPVFESAFRLKADADGYNGIWIKGTSGKDAVMPVRIYRAKEKFPGKAVLPVRNLAGRWSVTFIRPNGTTRPAVSEFQQDGDHVKGTFLTPSGDYRYLSGRIIGDSLQLSCFDGSHAYYFGAKLLTDGSLAHGVFASGPAWLERWYASRNPNAKIDESISSMQLRPGEESLGFRFPNLDSQLVSIRDERFRDKVVVVQIMGSWCPNCMDETAFLSEYYRNNRHRGIEMIALAYEYSTDFQRARKSLVKFRDKFDVQYPMLITGVTSGDSLKTEKTLPQLTPIKAFPSSIFIGRDGKVKKIHAGFYGPGTGSYYDAFKKEFEETIEALLKQQD